MLVTAIAAFAAFQSTSIATVYRLILAVGTGPGLVLILRWYWWRVNAWSEVSAMATAFVVSLAAQAFGLSSDDPRGFAWLLLLTTATETRTVVPVADTCLEPSTYRSLGHTETLRVSGRRNNLNHALLRNANLAYTNLQRANLVGADLSGACLTGADLAGARISGANLEAATDHRTRAHD